MASSDSSMNYIAGSDRGEVLLLPEVLDDYSTPENPVRFIDAFVAELDVSKAGFTNAQLNETGRPPYDPGDLLRLYLYGYLNRVRSSRGLEREAARNLELIWLLRKLRPDFKTIADFRRDNAKAIKAVGREFILLCRKLELFGGELFAVPMATLDCVSTSAPSACSPASPKSSTLVRPSASTSTLSGFRSRWTTARACA